MQSAEGGCRCGNLRFKVNAPPMLTLACHCTGCQRMTGSAFSLGAAYPKDSFEVASGEPVIGGMHGAIQHFFCPSCMSWVFTRPSPEAPFVMVRGTMLDTPDPRPPFLETWTSEKLPWAETGAPKSYPGFPDPSEFPEILAEFAASAMHNAQSS